MNSLMFQVGRNLKFLYPDQVFVYALGSSIVMLISKASEAGRRMRSITCSWSECGRPPRSIQVLSLRPIVSTTSVSPSYQPRMLAPVGEDLAHMVIELEQFNHPARGLNDLK